MRRLAPLLLFACRPVGDGEDVSEAPSTAPVVIERAPAEPEGDGTEASSPGASLPEASMPGAPSPEASSPSEAVLVVTDPEVLAALPGLSLAEVALGTTAHGMAELSRDPAFKSITAVIAADLRRDAEGDPKAGVGTHNPHRQFDRRWLARKNVDAELVAVVNRLDRHPFEPEHCGEVRLIYRLAYEAQLKAAEVHSRLPMTFNVVLWQDGADCQQVAQRWLAPAGQGPDARARWLRRPEGPLAPERIGPAQLLAVEVNLQSVRWPSAVRPGMAGHAEYLLRVFHRRGDRFVSVPLENTPDVERLRKNGGQRAELLEWLRQPDQVAALDDGVVVIPERFLATRATSVTPRGMARLSNRPFSRLLSVDDFAELDYSGLRHVRSPAAMLRRLDGLTCGGCHESRSVAGFHVVGEDVQGQVIDAVAVPLSPHLAGDLDRREAYVRAVAQGRPGARERPLSERDARPGSYGTHCGLGDPGFAHWTCAPGLVCRALADPLLGVCVESTPGAGDPCEVGTMHEHDDPHRDSVRAARRLTCDDAAVCNGNAVGFPDGMCTELCDGLDPGEACGPLVSLRPFNLCVGRRRPFGQCITENASPVGMRGCDRDHPCRDDYICARSGHDDPKSEGGVCLPPYFLFQFRVDGHVM